jgi:AAA15 family ATPase/GTPase
LSISFEKGKNIIVGKNNAGKSNIIKAIDLVLGESSPTWHKSENITANDFFNGDTSKPIFIFCELTRDLTEKLNYEEIYKCFGFKYHAYITEWVKNEKGKNVPIKAPVLHTLDQSSFGSFIGSLDAVMNIGEDDEGIDSQYVNPKLKNQGTFESALEDKFSFAFGFRAYQLGNGKFHKEIRFFFRQNENAEWVMAFSAPVRNELLQSAIIHSFRDPANELRINQWSWFGKLLKEYIKADDPDLRNAFDLLKSASNGVFKELQEEINNSKVKVAFPDTSITFQFNPDTKIDIYKSALIYVNDGFNSLLQDKGSGIQSAVIIGLYNYYTNNIAHSSSSLLAVEEPEIYLHPQARRVISHRIDDFLQGNKNQVIITTHSTEFITSAHENLNIIVTKKQNQLGTKAKNTKFDSSKEKQILVKSQNAEMFFADKVILVEGGDKYVIESIAKFYGANVNVDLGENWINEHNISIIAVGGKTEFWKYVKKLNELEIPVFVLSDFDFFLRQLSEYFTGLGYKKDVHDELNGLRSKLQINNTGLAKNILNHIQVFAESIVKEGLKADEKTIRSSLKEPFRLKRLTQFDANKQDLILEYLKRLRKINLFVMQNELEDYYTDYCNHSCKGISGKEEKPIHIVSRLVSAEMPIVAFVNPDEYFDFLSFVAS